MNITLPQTSEFSTVMVSDILANVKSSCDLGDVEDYGSPEEFWVELIESKAGDPGFGYLIEDILDNGWHKDSAIGLNMGGNSGDPCWRITEGHHRLIAAILLCMDEVPYDDWGSDPRGEIKAGNYGKRISCHSPKGCDKFPIHLSYDL